MSGKMYFAIGYQIPESGEYFSDIVMDYKEKVHEVYFAWPGMPSGRPVFGKNDRYAQSILEEELKYLSKNGIALDLLLNANCFGENAISTKLRSELLGLLNHLEKIACFPSVVTTASPFIAHIIGENFPGIELRSSVNMRIGTAQAMEYASEYFTSFYLQRDYQRDIGYAKRISDWCKAHGKKLCILANSGCLRFCPSQTFHDNLISHSEGAEKVENIQNWNPHLCQKVYKNPDNFAELIKATWIRPEDVPRYEGIADVVKLATRQHSHPRKVISAYASGNYDGDLAELFEPGFSSLFFPFYLDNKSFPSDFAEKVDNCHDGCHDCGYCEGVLDRVLKKYGSE